MRQIDVMKDLLADNQKVADYNRQLLRSRGIFTVNLLGSPGTGKTSLLEGLIKSLKDQVKIGVIEGDLYTTKDAKRIEKEGIQVIQLNTKGACHLEATMVSKAIADLDLAELDLLVVENVGNLVCTASFDLGEDSRVTVLSVTEGSDKPLKYADIFQNSEAVVINKIDLLGQTDFSMEEVSKDLQAINQDIKIFKLSAVKGEGLMELGEYLKDKVNSKKLAAGSN